MNTPLADRIRPQSLDDIVGQKLFARKFVARDYKFPIPKEEILRNPALGEQQNPGW